MKIAIISDIHSNLEALKEVLLDIGKQKVDQVLCAGDIVGYGPNPKECLALVRSICSHIVRGNHEDLVLGIKINNEQKISPLALAGRIFSADNLSADDLFFINSLPDKKILTDLNITIAHGSFIEPCAWSYVDKAEDAQIELTNMPTKICAIGHTHIPFVYENNVGMREDISAKLVLKESNKFLINVGSVGQPRDGDCRASYAILEFSDKEIFVTLRRVFYDIGKTEAAFKNTNLPNYLAERLFKGR